jgi:serine/threonine protein phosphatase PrpC
VAFFGVYDGHCGSEASRWCAKTIHAKIDKLDSLDDKSIRGVMLEADKEFCDENGTAWCTSCFALVDWSDGFPYKITAVNIGDSRCVIGRQFGEDGAKKMTTDRTRLRID